MAIICSLKSNGATKGKYRKCYWYSCWMLKLCGYPSFSESWSLYSRKNPLLILKKKSSFSVGDTVSFLNNSQTVGSFLLTPSDQIQLHYFRNHSKNYLVAPTCYLSVTYHHFRLSHNRLNRTTIVRSEEKVIIDFFPSPLH